MAQLLVRGLTKAVVEALKEKAHLHGVSAEQEHRRILEEALLKPEKISFEELLATMPDVAEDQDFERVPSKGRKNGLPD